MRYKWEKNDKESVLNDPALNQVSSSLKNVIDEDEDSFDESESSSLNFINADFRTPKHPYWNIYKGIFYSSLSSIFFSICSVIVKYMKHIHPGQLSFFRFIGIFILSIPLVHFYGQQYLGPSDIRHLLILRG